MAGMNKKKCGSGKSITVNLIVFVNAGDCVSQLHSTSHHIFISDFIIKLCIFLFAILGFPLLIFHLYLYSLFFFKLFIMNIHVFNY